jgi:urea transport system permease protein
MGDVETPMSARAVAIPSVPPQATRTSPSISAPARKLFTARGWALFAFAALVILVALPISNLMLPAGHPLHISDYLVTLLGKIMCYAIVALAMD